MQARVTQQGWIMSSSELFDLTSDEFARALAAAMALENAPPPRESVASAPAILHLPQKDAQQSSMKKSRGLFTILKPGWPFLQIIGVVAWPIPLLCLLCLLCWLMPSKGDPDKHKQLMNEVNDPQQAIDRALRRMDEEEPKRRSREEEQERKLREERGQESQFFPTREENEKRIREAQKEQRKKEQRKKDEGS
jgi:hypothetical protein